MAAAIQVVQSASSAEKLLKPERLRMLEMLSDPVGENGKRFELIAFPRDEPARFILNVGQRSKSVVLDFENPIDAIERSRFPAERQGHKLWQRHGWGLYQYRRRRRSR